MENKRIMEMVGLEREMNKKYEAFKEAIQNSFAKVDNRAIFNTDMDTHGMWEMYLEAIPEPFRQYYNCNTCRSFFRKYAGLVNVNTDTLEIESVLWNFPDEETDNPLMVLGLRFNEMVNTSRITEPFIPKSYELGAAFRGGFDHIHVELPANTIVVSGININNEMAKIKENKTLLMKALDQYSITTIDRALSLLRSSNNIFRAETFLPVVERFRNIRVRFDSTKNMKLKNNLAHYISITDIKCCRIANEVIGTLLDDIVSTEFDNDDMIDRFNAKVDPIRYQRTGALPNSSAVKNAEKLISELGLESALYRREADIDEVDKLKIWISEKDEVVKKTGLFKNVVTVEDTDLGSDIEISHPSTAREISVNKFISDILPRAKNMKILTASGMDKTVVTTQFNDDAKPILKWDCEEERNPFSWIMLKNANMYDEVGYKDVSCILRQPNMIGKNPHTEMSDGIIFIIPEFYVERDITIGLFPEVLISQLHPIRKVISGYNEIAKLEKIEKDKSLWGLSIQKLSGGGGLIVSIMPKDSTIRENYRLTLWE